MGEETAHARRTALDLGRRRHYLLWLAGRLATRGLPAVVLGEGSEAVLRLNTRRSGRVRFVACVPAPQAGTWAWVWPEGWALVTDTWAVASIVEAMDS